MGLPLPTGTVTFLFTDVEGSTKLLKELGRNVYLEVVAEHRRLLREAFAGRGVEVDTQGDALFVAFPRAKDAVVAAAGGQRALAAHDWPGGCEVRVRMGLHTGEAILAEKRYVGLSVHRAARICAAARGGQVLLSQATASVLEDEDLDVLRLRDLGHLELKDFDDAERLFEIELVEDGAEAGPELGGTLAVETARIQICGRVVATLAGRRIEDGLPGRQGRLVFVYLVCNRLRPVGRDEVMEALWPGALPPAAESALSALLSKVRRAVGPDTLEGRTELRLALPADTFVDYEAAEEGIHRAESAVRRGAWADAWVPARIALHTATRGFLPGEDAPWIAERRRRLVGIQLRAHECVAQAGIGLGGPELDSALRSGHELVRIAPFHETGYRLLMQALDADGNAAEALAIYDRLRVRLREELGTAPGKPTQELYRTLLG